jgi:hypothetical protein
MKQRGLYANINAKRARIKAGSDERMRKPNTKGAPTAKAFKESKKTSAAEVYRKYKTIFKAIERKHGIVGMERKIKAKRCR